jgi:intracellular sulfur oxidation DsrE/DsrF family protein
MKKRPLVFLCVLLIASGASAGQAGNAKSLKGLQNVKFVVDVNVGDPDLLLKRMDLLDRTYRQLVDSGRKPTVVVAFRGRASLFITKGDGSGSSEMRDAKLDMKKWIERFAALGFTLEQCAIAAEMLGIDVKDFLPQIDVVENGYVSLIGYQQQGYAFLPMD